tara:strand:+ start:304 stop:450 length:147 start_codon:yes stop_codon:yes gene_type:complete
MSLDKIGSAFSKSKPGMPFINGYFKLHELQIKKNDDIFENDFLHFGQA